MASVALLRARSHVATPESQARLPLYHTRITRWFDARLRRPVLWLSVLHSRTRARPMRLYEVAAGILWNGTQVLIARRQEGDHQGGRWEFPGGKRHKGESI